MRSIAIVGTGISGLSAAHFISKKYPNAEIHLIEANSRVGGNFNSEELDSFIFEYGPRGVLKNSHAFFHLLESANSWSTLIPGKKTSSKRFVWFRDKLEQLGGGVFNIFRSPLMKGVFGSILRERKLVSKPVSEDETVQQFFERRFGQHITHHLVDAFVTGIWAGDISKLSVKSVFPSVYLAEKNHGSVVSGILKMRKERKFVRMNDLRRLTHPKLPKGRFFTVRGGLQRFAETLAKPFRKNLYLNQHITHIEKNGELWDLTLNDSRKILVDHLAFSTPAFVTGNQLRNLDHDLSQALIKIDYVPVAVVNFGYRKFTPNVDGFGFLVPFNQNKNILGVIFNSGTFDHVSPEGGMNVTVMMGGAHHEEIVEKTEGELTEIALESMKSFLKIEQKPDVIRVKKWQHAIPQYNVGHSETIQQIFELNKKYKNLHLLGNWKDGIGINDCIKNSFNWAEKN